MSDIVYFNINFTCNNKCVFCFSHNVGDMSREIPIEKFIQLLNSISLQKDDIVVINGGEPSLHSEFDSLLKYAAFLPCACKIYTNGRKLNIENSLSDNISFIIPVHGNKLTHNLLTRAEKSYEETVASLRLLDKNRINYNLKFIISKEMIQDNFDVLEFLEYYRLSPQEIHLSRMNVTVKSNKNQYSTPSFEDEYEYLMKLFKLLSNTDFTIKFLDFPPCYFDYLRVEYNLITTEEHNFFYNDYNHFMEKRTYKKNRILKSECNYCEHIGVCDLLSNSYYLFEYKGNHIIELKLE